MSNILNINPFINSETITKQILQLKPPWKNGLILQLQNITYQLKTQQKLCIRFLHLAFDKSENILVASNHTGNIVLLDLDRNKFWILPRINSCTVVKFSTYNPAEVILGMQNGLIYIVNIQSGEITGELKCHCLPVLDITFAQTYICLSASKKEAIIWDLRTNVKIQVLTLIEDCLLKHVMFIPVVDNILACFDDDSVLIWKFPTFEVYKEIRLAEWQANSIKSIAFTRNGRAVIFAGHLPQLVIFTIDTWAILNKIVLPDYITSLKKIAFIPQIFDGGSNKILAILTGSGVLHFYDMEQNLILNKIATDTEIVKFDSSFDGKYIACLFKTGEISIYGGTQCIHPKNDLLMSNQLKPNRKSRNVIYSKKNGQLAVVQKKINDFLDVDKLRSILKEFGEYPDAYRSRIWSQLLKVPNNNEQYNNFINDPSNVPFLNLSLESKSSLQTLKKLLSNLITWCPYFEHVTYLPVFVFPFTKLFQNDPICCFEMICTIILNWCQHWFEYFPLPPINVLAMIENLLLEHDEELLTHFTAYDITSKIYAWPLLEAAFSEVLPTTQWCVLWDHILSNEPPFLIMTVIAYNIINRKSLLTLKTKEDFQYFYHNQNIINMKQFTSKCYALLNKTSEKNHPNRYLDPFRSMQSGPYPSFAGFPKNVIDFNFAEFEKLKQEKVEIKKEQSLMLTQKQVFLQNLEIAELQKVEEERLNEMENACRQKIIEETERVKEQRSRINELRNQLQLEEIDLLNKSRQRILTKNTKQRQLALEKLLGDVHQNRVTEEMEIVKAEGDLVKRYSELLHQKIKLEETLQTELPVPGLSNEYRLLKIQQQKLIESLDAIKHSAHDDNQIKNITIATGISAMDDLIMQIEMELATHMADKYENVNRAHSGMKLLKLESETKQLEMEVSKLLSVLAEIKSQETKQRLVELHDNVRNAKNLKKLHGSQYVNLQRPSHLDKVSRIDSFGDDFAKLRQMIHEACEPEFHNDGNSIYEEKEIACIELETD